MKRILFVDDEQQVLDGLRDLLRKHRKEWEMAFALGGEEALKEMRSAPYDVIVTDIRMPKMDGAQLLSQVMAEFPQMVRIVLSGHAEMEATLRTIAVAHQFLSKPCNVTSLENTVKRAFALRELIHDVKVKEAVGIVTALPSRPQVYLELVERLKQDDCSAKEVAGILERDLAMCAKVLQVVNSSFFGAAHRFNRIEDAVVYLGSTTIRDLALSVSVFGWGDPVGIVDQVELQRHALLVGGIARNLLEDKQMAEEAFLAGMMHDIGILLQAARFPERLAQSVEAMREGSRPLHLVEMELHDSTHAELGAYLLALWGFSDTIIEAVAFHHRPGAVEQEGLGVLGAVHVADALAHEIERDRSGKPPTFTEEMDLGYAEAMGVLGSLDGWREMAREVSSAMTSEIA